MSEEPPVDRKNLSQAPSWIMVGFLGGVLTMWAFRSNPAGQAAAVPPPPTAAEVVRQEPNPTVRPEKPSLEVVEGLFDAFRDYAFWNEDRTEIAVWNAHALAFSDHYEVLRAETGLYFRPIRAFTRLPLENYGPPNSPLRFTETAEQRAKRYFEANPEELPPAPPRPGPVDLPTLPRPSGGSR